MKRTIGVIGGDRRQAELAQLLAADGHVVNTYGLDQWNSQDFGRLKTAIDSEIVILPLPLCKGEGALNCTETPISTAELFQKLRPEQKILAGQIQPQQIREAADCGLKIEDYFLREEVTIANAAITAEAAVQVALERLEQSIQGMDCLVVGFGRIGKLLSRNLSGLGARVTATARSSADLAWIRACGWEAVRTGALNGALNKFDVVFNTVPSLVLNETLLCQLPKSCLCIDLASQQGIDLNAAERLGLPHVWARALPGRLKPRTAAKILQNAIYNILLEG